MSSSQKKSVLSELVAFWEIFASLSFAEVERIALFSRLIPPRFDLSPSLICFTSAQDLSANPIPSLLDVTWQATKQKMLV